LRLGPAAFALTLACLMLASPLATGEGLQLENQGTGYSNSSWALGVVAPEGSGLSDGASLRWESVNNVTVLVSLPNITLPDRVVYSVLSVMTGDGGIMQVAAGVYPNRSAWLTYSWVIPRSDTTTPTYQWILNGSEPRMAQNSRISMSIFHLSGLWSLRVTDEGTNSSVERQFPPGLGPALKAGDQEVFALESYSRTSSTFREMGNLTLESLLVDDQRVTGGFYSYGDWDPNHDPLFVVGSAGTSPPSFISLEKTGDGSFAWEFAGLWQGEDLHFGQAAVAVVVVAVLTAAVLGAVALRFARKRRPLSG